MRRPRGWHATGAGCCLHGAGKATIRLSAAQLCIKAAGRACGAQGRPVPLPGEALAIGAVGCYAPSSGRINPLEWSDGVAGAWRDPQSCIHMCSAFLQTWVRQRGESDGMG